MSLFVCNFFFLSVHPVCQKGCLHTTVCVHVSVSEGDRGKMWANVNKKIESDQFILHFPASLCFCLLLFVYV